MGSVYGAVRDDDAFEKRVAIKVIKRNMDTDEVLAASERKGVSLRASSTRTLRVCWTAEAQLTAFHT